MTHKENKDSTHKTIKNRLMRKIQKAIFSVIAILLFFIGCRNGSVQNLNNSMKNEPTSFTDTNKKTITHGEITVMSYNVLKYGNSCQAPNGIMHAYLKTIIQNANPDILGLVKVNAFKLTAADQNATGPVGFGDSILSSALNVAYPGRYAFCPPTNIAGADNMNLLFYDKNKFGFFSEITLCSFETDFDLYKLYYKKNLNPADTSFLYIVLNHTKSGKESTKRDQQMQTVEDNIKKYFKRLPDLIDMGDFNLKNTEEPGYKLLTAGDNPDFRFFDPPFNPDSKLKYPADWTDNPDGFAKYLTTSTRKKDDNPNTCGTGGGAKLWFDHILISPSIANGTGRFKYASNSYHTFGNDGLRNGISVTSENHHNTTVPPEVSEALFQFSNKYPVMLELSVK